MHCVRCAGAYLDLNGPGEVADIDKEGDVGAVAEVKVLIRETVLELFDVTAGHNRDLFTRLSSCWSGGRRVSRGGGGERGGEGERGEGKMVVNNWTGFTTSWSVER